MNIKNIKFVLLFLFIASFVSCKNNNSQTTRPAGESSEKFAFVDRKVVESKMVALKNIEKSFLKEEGKIRNDLMSKKSKLEDKYKNLEKSKNEGILDRKALESKAKEIEKEFFELQQSEREAGELMNFVKMQISFEINQKIQESTREIGEKNKYLMVLDSGTLFYIDNAQVDDLTFDVLASINANFKKLEIEKYFEEAKKTIEKMKKSSQR